MSESIDLGRASGSAYGNPAPCHYGDGDDERFALAGLLKVQGARLFRARRDGRERDVRSARGVIDELLDHWPYADDRSASQAIDAVEWPRDPEPAPVITRADGSKINGHTGAPVLT